MEIKIEGNPGTGNTFVENKYEHVENNFPNVTEVTIIKEADGTRRKMVRTSGEITPDQNSAGRRTDILRYAETTLPYVLFKWKGKYMDLWNDILDLPEVAADIYNKHRQRDIDFNRYLFCHIICYLGKHSVDGYGIFENYNATHIARSFGDGAESTTRPQLGFQPSSTIRNAIDQLLQSKKYQLK